MRVTDEMVEAFANVYHFRGQTYAPDLVRAALEAALSHAAGQEGEKKVDWIAENHHDYWVVRVLCAETPRFYSIRKSDGQMLELPHKDSPFVPFPAQPTASAEVGRDSALSRGVPEDGSLRSVAKRNLRSLINIGSDDKALMLKCLEELS